MASAAPIDPTDATTAVERDRVVRPLLAAHVRRYWPALLVGSAARGPAGHHQARRAVAARMVGRQCTVRSAEGLGGDSRRPRDRGRQPGVDRRRSARSSTTGRRGCCRRQVCTWPTTCAARAFTHLQRLSLGYHKRHQVGDLTTRVTADVDYTQDMLVQMLANLFPNLLLVVGMFVVMLTVDPFLTLLSLLTTPLLACDPSFARQPAPGVAACPQGRRQGCLVGDGEPRRHRAGAGVHARAPPVRPLRGAVRATASSPASRRCGCRPASARWSTPPVCCRS